MPILYAIRYRYATMKKGTHPMRTLVTVALFALLPWPAFAQAPAAPGAAAPAAENAGKPLQVGAGDLLITPGRVVLEGRKRTETVLLNNRGAKEATYRITLEHKRMLETGAYQSIDDKHPATPDDKFADDVVRYSPRQVTLKPGESQNVKFMLRAPDGTPDGEYRSHILFQGQPEDSKGTNIDQAPIEKNQVRVKITPVYGLSIPLIARVGNLTATTGITDATVKDGKELTFTLTRQGGKSVYGDMSVTNSAGIVVAQVKGVALFPPLTKRQVSIKLTPPEGASVAGPLTITYREREEDGGNVLAEGKTK